jgi:hypothetical protein
LLYKKKYDANTLNVVIAPGPMGTLHQKAVLIEPKNGVKFDSHTLGPSLNWVQSFNTRRHTEERLVKKSKCSEEKYLSLL